MTKSISIATNICHCLKHFSGLLSYLIELIDSSYLQQANKAAHINIHTHVISTNKSTYIKQS
jgi:hypothetical protein